MIKNEFNNNVKPTRTGNNTYVLSKLFFSHEEPII